LKPVLALVLLTLVSSASAQELRPATYCGACHGPIRREWATSTMGTSWKNPVFQAFLADAKAQLGDKTLKECIACHAPAASVTADVNFESKVSQEGITCNFCHNVSAVDPSPRPASYTFDTSDPQLMRGPYQDSDPGGAHKFVYSELHTKSELCAACHEHASHGGTGVPIETTYSRWKASDAASEGEQCQDCHMPAYSGSAAPHVSKMKRSVVHGHGFPAARTPGFLDSVVTMTVKPKGPNLEVTIANRKAGHSLPGGGGGMRAIALSVSFYGAKGDSLGSTDVEIYGIRYADQNGRSPVPKWLAATVAHQKEIPTSGSITETCGILPGAKRAVARLTYYSIDPAYLPALAKRQVDLSDHRPVVMARAAVMLP